jgi:DNA-damage-inducible protein D
MLSEKIIALKEAFESVAQTQEGIEYWTARDLQTLLGYVKWEKFTHVIEKAIQAAENSGENPKNHFLHVGKLVKIGSEAERAVEDFLLTRYACYLIAQNGDARKEEIAFAQSYFALQTRKQELIEERMMLNERLKARQKLSQAEKEMSQIIFERGVDNEGFARIRSVGDQVLFGGFTTEQMKKKLDVPKNRPLADFLPEISITAKSLAAQVTSFNVKQKNLQGETPIAAEHISNNQNLRTYLIQQGIRPEELPAAEDIKKLERRVKSVDKQVLKSEKNQHKNLLSSELESE